MNPLETLVSAMTLAELSEKTGKSVADIVAFAAKRSAEPRVEPATKQTTTTAAPRVTKAHGKGVNTRTPEGRAAYDTAVLSWLKENASKGNPQPSSAVIEACGGTTLQSRTTLNRLIESGRASFVGKARSTKYWAT